VNPFVSAAGAAVRATKAVVHGKRIILDDKTLEARRVECHARKGECYDAKFDRCRLCNCIVRAKTTLATESCPRGFWTAITK
jgi:hypothetical protein